MGSRSVFGLITNSTRLLTNHARTTTLCGVHGPRALGKGPTLIITLVRLPLYLLGFSLTAPAHPPSAPLTYSTIISRSVGTCSIDIDLVGEHTEKIMSGPTGVHIFLVLKRSKVKRLR